MDYKEKYEQAIKRAKAMIPIAANQEEIYNSVITIFPELKESEDERIRKAILWCLRTVELELGCKDVEGIAVAELKSWLEKQCEQKPEWSEEDRRMLIGLIDELDAIMNKATPNEISVYSKYTNWLKSLRPQSQWKPSDEQMKSLDIAIRCGIQLGTWEEDALKSLAEQLKKLKG